MSFSPLTQDDFIALLRRTTDADGWLDPILADPDGGAVLGAAIAMVARVATAAQYNNFCDLIGTAPGGAPGLATLTVARGTTGTSGTIPTGYLFIDARGVQLRVASDVTVHAGDATLAIPLSTLRQTEMTNTEDDPGVQVDPGSGVLLDSLGTTALLAPAGSLSIVATTFLPGVSTQILGGQTDWLSVHGNERAQRRQPGEPTESYRARVRSIPDAVSPIALADAIVAAASRFGIGATLLEPFDDGASVALKTMHGLGFFEMLAWSSTNVAGTQVSAAASPGADFLDDSGLGREMGDRRSATAYFRVLIASALVDRANETFWLDDGFWDDPIRGYLDVGEPPTALAQSLAIWEEANRKKAGGVAFDVEADVVTVERGSGHSNTAGEATVFTIASAGGKGWLLVDGVADHDGALNTYPPGLVLPVGAYHKLKFTYSDGSTFFTPAYVGGDSERLTPDRISGLGGPRLPITQVDGLVHSDGAAIVNLLLELRVIEMALS